MRFRFCGDADCPDWILAEINSMARLSSVKMKLLSQHVAKSVLGEEIDYDKVKKLTADAKFDVGDAKACIAAVSYILKSSSRHGVEEEPLCSELQQLGLPKEHATALCKVHHEHMAAITEMLRRKSLRLSRLEDARWRVDVVTASSRRRPPSQGHADPEIDVQLALDVTDPGSGTGNTDRVCLSPSQLQTLIFELQKATAIMNTLVE